MQRKFVSIVALAIIILVSWTFWSSGIEINHTITILQRNSYFTNDFILEPSHKLCESKSFILILVTSYIGHVELRSAHRRAMPPEFLKSMNIIRIFLLAKIPQKEKYISQEAVNDEHKIFGDILQGSFVENYRNLTHKHLMGLQWASTVCDQATFILKVDDDTVYNLNRTYEFLSKLKIVDKRNFFIGYMLNGTKPRRSKQNKWYVTWEEYPRNEYPPYLSGWYYITTPKTATKISVEARHHPYFWIDDIFLTGLITESLDIKLQQLPEDFWLEYYELLECCLRDMIKKFIRCNYVVGPNGGRNNLIVEFNEAITHCDNWSNCTMRPGSESLNKVCVAHKDRDIFGNGEAQVQYIKL